MGAILLVTTPFSAPVSAQLQSLDLRLHTAGVEGPVTNRRSFTVSSGARAITVRFRFQTNEVPGGWFGSQYDDSFSVAILGSSGTRAIDSSSMNALGLGAFDATGATAWREISLDILPNEHVTVEFEVKNVGDGLFDLTLLIDLIDQETMAISKAATELFDIDGTPLQFLSAEEMHPYFGGVTRIHGTVRVTGAPTDSLAELSLEALQGTAVVATAQLTEGLHAQLLTEFGEDGVVAVSTPQRMFDLLPQFNDINVSQNSTVTLRVVARTASGEVRSRTLRSAVPILARYLGMNRYDTPANLDPRDTTKGGDDWAKPSTKQVADHFAANNSYNDFSSMHGGHFPPHDDHDTGNDIDGWFQGYNEMTSATACVGPGNPHTCCTGAGAGSSCTAQRVIAQLTDPAMGSRITTVYVSDKAKAKFVEAIAAAGLSSRVRVDDGGEHRGHYHWVVPDFGGAAAAAASAPSGGRQP